MADSKSAAKDEGLANSEVVTPPLLSAREREAAQRLLVSDGADPSGLTDAELIEAVGEYEADLALEMAQSLYEGTTGQRAPSDLTAEDLVTQAQAHQELETAKSYYEGVTGKRAPENMTAEDLVEAGEEVELLEQAVSLYEGVHGTLPPEAMTVEEMLESVEAVEDAKADGEQVAGAPAQMESDPFEPISGDLSWGNPFDPPASETDARGPGGDDLRARVGDTDRDSGSGSIVPGADDHGSTTGTIPADEMDGPHPEVPGGTGGPRSAPRPGTAEAGDAVGDGLVDGGAVETGAPTEPTGPTAGGLPGGSEPVEFETVYDAEGNPVLVGPGEVATTVTVYETPAGVYVHPDGTPLTKAEAIERGLDPGNQPDAAASGDGGDAPAGEETSEPADEEDSSSTSEDTDDGAGSDDKDNDNGSDNSGGADDGSDESDETNDADDGSGSDDTGESGSETAPEEEAPPEDDSAGTPDPTGDGPPPDGWLDDLTRDQNFQIDMEARRMSEVNPSPVDDPVIDTTVSLPDDGALPGPGVVVDPGEHEEPRDVESPHPGPKDGGDIDWEDGRPPSAPDDPEPGPDGGGGINASDELVMADPYVDELSADGLESASHPLAADDLSENLMEDGDAGFEEFLD